MKFYSLFSCSAAHQVENFIELLLLLLLYYLLMIQIDKSCDIEENLLHVHYNRTNSVGFSFKGAEVSLQSV